MRSDTPDIPEQTARASWRDCGYPGGPDEFSDTGDYLRRLLPHIVVAHLHSNDRIRDRHWLPTDRRGLTDWAEEMPVLCSAPRLASLQSESSPSSGNPYTIRQQVESLRSIAALGGLIPDFDAVLLSAPRFARLEPANDKGRDMAENSTFGAKCKKVMRDMTWR